MMASSAVKLQCNRKNKSRKKTQLVYYMESIIMDPSLIKSFIGKKETLPSLLAGYKVSLHFDILKDQQVLLKISTKHRNHLQEVISKLVGRYNKIVTITNNLISCQSKKC